MFGFIISCVALMYSILSMLYLATDKVFFLGMSNTFMFLALIGNLGWTVCGTVFRYKHYGRVCSGDFFNQELYSEVPPFQWKSGRFIFVYLLILWLFWIMFIISSIVSYFCCLLGSKKKWRTKIKVSPSQTLWINNNKFTYFNYKNEIFQKN